MTAASEPVQLPLSVLIRTLNEGDRIARTLRSVAPLGAEVVVVDAGSKDDTAAIARSLGAVVYQNPWPGFGPQRHFGEEKCSNDMIFSLDADEAATEALVAEIKRAFAAGPARLMIVRKASVFPGYDKPWPWSFCHEQILIYDRRVARTGPNPNWDKLEIATKEAPIRLQQPALALQHPQPQPCRDQGGLCRPVGGQLPAGAVERRPDLAADRRVSDRLLPLLLRPPLLSRRRGRVRLCDCRRLQPLDPHRADARARQARRQVTAEKAKTHCPKAEAMLATARTSGYSAAR